jgi:hypothetical protein
LPFLVMPEHHDVRAGDVHLRRLHGNLAAAAERGAADFPDLLLTPGVGARTVRALALVAEVVHGAPCRFSDPARFSLAQGGKDRHPFPVPLKVYDETIRVLKSAVQRAKLGQDEQLAALQKLDEESRSWNGRRKARRSRACLRTSARTLISMAAAAFSAGSLPSNPPPIVARHRRGGNDALREPAPVPPESDLGADAALVPSGRTPDN